MRTDDLVAMLAAGAGVAESRAARRRYAIAVGWAALGATLLMMMVLGVRPDLAQAVLLPMFWVKFAYVAGLAWVCAVVAWRLSIPGRRLGSAPKALAAPVLSMWALAAVELGEASEGERQHLILGETWASCPVLIAILSLPLFIALLWATKRLAPTRLRIAGAAAGGASGTIAALIYSFHCPELAAPFLGFWYLLGVSIPIAAGALLGPRLLRW